jgi:uncharacterized protein (TIGR03000 family)
MNKRSSVSLVASVLALVLIASPAFAQWRGGGGRYYGGYGGGRYYGGYGGWGNGYYQGSYPYYGGYYSNYGYPGGLGLGLSLGGLGYSGYYYGNGPYYSNSLYYGTPYLAAPGTEVSINSNRAILSNYQVQNPGGGPVINANAPTVAMQSFYSGPSPTTGKADLTVKVPADAQVWLGSLQSGQTGAERRFSFPALPPGSNMFTLRATWTENGQAVTREKQVDMKAGGNETVDFTKAGEDKPRTNTPMEPKPAPGSAFDIKKNTPPVPATTVPKK